MKILGIDPGYDRLGIAVIEKGGNNSHSNSNKERLLYSDCFQTSSKDSIYIRLQSIGIEIDRIIEKFKPDMLGIETLFLDKNQKTAMRVAEARGIIIYEATKRNIAIHEYSPMEIKMAITGDGTSDKARMIKMVGLLIDMNAKKSEEPAKKIIDDEYDAIAIALTTSAYIKKI